MDNTTGSGGMNPGVPNGQMSQSALQQQLFQQLSQLSQQMQVPQQQQHTPQQQQQQLLLALARSSNLSNVAGLFSQNAAPAPDIAIVQATAPSPAVAAPQPAATNGNDEMRQRLLQQLSKPPAIATSAGSDSKPTAPPSLGQVGEVRAGFQGQPSAATAGSITADAAKDERRKAPGSVIVPCRARGMPMDHNFKTAYFVIPENVRHGEELICSYFACRNAGVKFRYCSHCKVPVAKRNFRKRHKHGDNLGKDTVDDDDQSGTEEDGCSDENETADVPSQVLTSSRSRKEAIPSQVTTKKDGSVGKKGRSEDRSKKSHIPSQVTTSSTGSKKDKSKPSKSGDGKGAGGPVVSDNSSVCMRSGDDRSKVIESRRKRWAFLLEKRPQTKDGEAMSSWLMQVLAVSDLWKPLNESEKMPNASLELIRECAQAGASEKKKKARSPSSKHVAQSNDSGSSDSQESNNQDGNHAENSSNDSDNQETETDKTDEDKANTKRKSMVLKKRPVVTLNDRGDENKNEKPPASKQKLEK